MIAQAEKYTYPLPAVRSRKVIQTTCSPGKIRRIVLGEHRNLMITSYDGDLFLCEGNSLAGAIKLLEAGETITLLDDTDQIISLTTETVDTRVRVIVW